MCYSVFSWMGEPTVRVYEFVHKCAWLWLWFTIYNSQIICHVNSEMSRDASEARKWKRFTVYLLSLKKWVRPAAQCERVAYWIGWLQHGINSFPLWTSMIAQFSSLLHIYIMSKFTWIYICIYYCCDSFNFNQDLYISGSTTFTMTKNINWPITSWNANNSMKW